MRKINGKLFLALLLGTAVLSGSVYGLHCVQYQRIAHALLDQARRSEDQGQTLGSVKYLQRYLEFNPRDWPTKAKLARIWAGDAYAGNSKARSSAVRLMDEVLTYEDDPDLRRLLVKTALEVREFKSARDHLTRLLSWDAAGARIKAQRAVAEGTPLPPELDVADKDVGELEGYWGQLLEGENKGPDAIDCYRLAVRHAPGQTANYARLAFLLRRKNEADPALRQQANAEADRVIDLQVKRNGTSADAFLDRWRYRRAFDLLAIREAAFLGQIPLEAAAQDVAEAIKLRHDSVEVLLAAADLERLRGRSALEDTGLTPEKRMARMGEHRAKAEEHLSRGLELVAKQGQGPGTDLSRFQLLWHKSNLRLDDLERLDGNREGPAPDSEAVNALKDEIRGLIDLVRKSPLPAAAEYLQGRLLVHERRWSEAAALFERAQKLLTPQPDLAAQADLFLGQCYERLEEHKQMYDAYKRVLDREPTSIPAQLGMAMASWSQGRLDDADAQFRLVMEQKKIPARVWFDVARLEIQRQLQSNKPDWKRAEAAVEQAGKDNPALVTEVTLLKANLCLHEKGTAEARRVLKAALRDRPGEHEYFAALVDLALRDRDFDKALKELEKGEKTGDTVTLRLARARLLAAQPDKEPAKAIRKLADERDKFREDDRARLLNGLAEGLIRLGADAEAGELWQLMAELPGQKNDLRLRLVLFDLALKAGDAERIDACLDAIKAVEQDSGAFHRYGTALKAIWLARSAGQPAERVRLLAEAGLSLEQVLSQRPSWAPAFVAKAEIAELNSNPEMAIANLKTAVEVGDASAGVMRKLVTLLQSRNKMTEAKELLEAHQRLMRSSNDLSRAHVAAILSTRPDDDKKQALALANDLVRGDNVDPGLLIWKAAVYDKAGNPGEAEKLLTLAITRAKAMPGPYLAKTQFLVQQKRTKDAADVLKEMKNSLPEAEVPLALGRGYELLGNAKKAKESYDTALKAKPTDPAVVRQVAGYYLSTGRNTEAEPLLRKLVSGEVKGGPDEQAWARRGLALVLASGADYVRFTEAMDLVGLKLDGEGRLLREDGLVDENAENRRTRARVLASQGQKQFRERAIEILERLRADKALAPDDQYVLALLYEAEGQYAKAEGDLAELAKESPGNPQYLARYAMSLIARPSQPDSLDKAEECVKALEELETRREAGPNGFASVELRARVLESRKEEGKALTLLREHVGRKGARPEEVLLLLAALARQQQFDEAFALLEKAWDEEKEERKVRPEVLGGVGVSLLKSMKIKDAQVEALERRLRAAIAAKPEATVLRMQLAELYDRRGRYAEAERAYRDVLEKEGRNFVALNNLAWLLAMRAGDSREALDKINEAVRGLGRRPDLLDTRGVIRLSMKEADQAVADLREAVAEGPTPNRLFHLARALHQTHDRPKAKQALLDAVAKGLKVAQLHPMEQEACKSLMNEYGVVE